MSHISVRGRALTRLAAFCLGTSALTLTMPALAAVVDYADGSNNSSPIVIADNSTQLQVLTGSATQSGPISQSSNSTFFLNKTGSGTLVLSGSNTFSGVTLVDSGAVVVTGSAGSQIETAGVFQIGNGGTTGTYTGSEIDIGSGGQAVFDRSDTYTYSGIITNITGSGPNNQQVVQAGTGTLILTGGINALGNVTISAGTLQVGNGGTAGSLASAVVDNSSLVFDLSGQGVFSGNVSGTGSLTQAGTGQLILTGNNTYSGGTFIASGTLQVGNLGVTAGTGSLGTGPVTNNSSLMFDLAGTVANTISGSGSLTQKGNAVLTLMAANSYTGATNIAAGTLALSGSGSIASSSLVSVTGGSGVLGGIFDISNTTSGASIQSLGGDGTVNLGSKTLTITAASTTFSGVISGTGGIVIAGGTQTLSTVNAFGSTSTYSGPTAINGGAALLLTSGARIVSSSGVTDNGNFDISGTTGISITTLSGTGTVALGGSALSLVNAAGIFSGTINGSGQVAVFGGTEILSGTNTYSGLTSIFSGTVQVGNGGTSGSIIGDVDDNGALNFDRSDNVNYSGRVSGRGSLAQQGGGILTLSSDSIYTGATAVNAGTLNVTGSISKSSITVASGATLTGTGKVGATTVSSGGTLTPGSSVVPGTLTIAGNLTLASGSNFVDAITPSAAGLASVNGTASINGNAIANFASGNYASGQYTLITAAGGVTGTFSSLATPGLPGSLHANLSYDANDVYLKLSPNALAPSLGSNVTTNQHNVVAAIDAAVMGGVVPSGGFNALYGLSGSALNSAIDQISGQVGPNVSNAVGQSFLSFLAVTAEGGAGGPGNYAPGSAYDAAAAPHRAQLDAGEARVWGGAYGGHVGLSADAASGAAGLSASNVGLIGGADIQLGDGILAGVTLDWGRQNFSSGNGSGLSTDYAFGLYGRVDQGPAYVTAAFGYGWHQITTLRVVTMSGTDLLQGKQNADDFGGRIEAGWRLALDDTYTIVPYGAFAGESFESPAYAETALAGGSTFALSYAAHTSTLGRSELGTHLDRSYDLGNGALTADLKVAWAHQLDDQPFTQANFENLATASFQVLGVRPTRDTALLGADIELQYRSGLFLGLKGESQFGAGTTILEGMGNVGLRW